MATYLSTKTYGHNIGISAAFRQWRAESHCHFLHGYAFEIRMEFEADDLDHNNWVVDFGSLKPIKKWIEDTFDHKTLVAQDDPEIDTFKKLHDQGIIDIMVVPSTGCEAFARLIYDGVDNWLYDVGYKPRVKLRMIEVREHGGNSGIYEG